MLLHEHALLPSARPGVSCNRNVTVLIALPFCLLSIITSGVYPEVLHRSIYNL